LCSRCWSCSGGKTSMPTNLPTAVRELALQMALRSTSTSVTSYISHAMQRREAGSTLSAQC
jgi:hypothetical protein